MTVGVSRDARARVQPAVVAGVAAVAVGVVLRFLTSSALWLDEAQSVSFAKLPLSQIPDALRQDGAPPLYYMLLHVWMAVFGDRDIAIRALSGVCSIAAIAVVAVAVDSFAGRRAAAFTVVVLATNPFAIRYATEGPDVRPHHARDRRRLRRRRHGVPPATAPAPVSSWWRWRPGLSSTPTTGAST